MSQEDWGNALQQELSDSQVASLKRAESMPTVLADEAWVSRMESILGRRLAPRPRGRPRKAA
jgi:hypothetical protein